MDERDMLLAVAIVPEGHDAEPAKTAGEIGDGRDAHADVMHAKAGTIVIFVAFDQLVERGDPGDSGARRVSHEGTIPRARRAKHSDGADRWDPPRPLLRMCSLRL